MYLKLSTNVKTLIEKLEYGNPKSSDFLLKFAFS